jgi:hypothetical protein
MVFTYRHAWGINKEFVQTLVDSKSLFLKGDES